MHVNDIESKTDHAIDKLDSDGNGLARLWRTAKEMFKKKLFADEAKIN